MSDQPTPPLSELKCTCEPSYGYTCEGCIYLRLKAKYEPAGASPAPGWQERYEAETRIVDEVWAALGISAYEQAQGKNIATLVRELRAENARLDGLINNPHTEDFLEAVRLEAAHQRERWKAEHDLGKTDPDWFWLIGYLAGKALNKPEKQLHHIITTAAACLNWHGHKTGFSTDMRPGTENTE